MTEAKAGRPKALTKRRWKAFLGYLYEGMSMKEACDQDDMPSRATVAKEIAESEEKQEQYRAACEIRALIHMEEIIDIADDGTNDWVTRKRKDGSDYDEPNRELIARSKVRIEARQYMLDRMDLKKWGVVRSAASKDGDLPTTIILEAAGADDGSEDPVTA